MFLTGMRRASCPNPSAFRLRRVLPGAASRGRVRQGAEGGAAPPAVVVSEVIRKDVPVYTEWVGTAGRAGDATIQAQVTGYLVKQNYLEGDLVRKGRSSSRSTAHLPGRRGCRQGLPGPGGSPLGNGQGEPQRVRRWPRRTRSARRTWTTTSAPNSRPGGRRKRRKAQLDTAQLNLGFTRITSRWTESPASRRPRSEPGGSWQIQELTAVSTVDPIKVYFSVSEQEYMNFRKEPGREKCRRRMRLAPSPLS